MTIPVFTAGTVLTAAELNAALADAGALPMTQPNTWADAQTFGSTINQSPGAGVSNQGPFLQAEDIAPDYIVSGLNPTVPSPASLTAAIPAGTAFVLNQRTLLQAAVQDTLPASSDTYFSMTNTGQVAYASVANGAAAPAAPANAVNLFRTITSPIVSNAPVLAASTAAGTLVAGTYEYQRVAYDATGYGSPSALISITTTATGEVILTWEDEPNEVSSDIYGRVSGSIGLLASGVTGTTWTDTGANAVGAAPPTVDTSNAIQQVVPLIATRAYTKSQTLTPQMFGAYGDGVHDDTIAIQTAVYYVLANGLFLYFPAGNYLISDQISIQTGEGWRISGESMGSVTITQQSDNTGIFVFVGGNSHSWRVSDFTFTWVNPQSSLQNNSRGIDLSGINGDPGYPSYYNAEIERIFGLNGYEVIGSNGTGTGLPWGLYIRTIWGDGCSGPTIGLKPLKGCPGNTIENVYVNGPNMAPGEYAILLETCGDLTINGLEINNLSTNANVASFSECNGNVGNITLEVGHWSENQSPIYMVNSILDIGVISAAEVTLDSTITAPFTFISCGGLTETGSTQTINSSCKIRGISFSNLTDNTGGNLSIIGASAPTSVDRVDIPLTAQLINNGGSAAASYIKFNDLVLDQLSSDNGANGMAFVYGSAKRQIWQTNLTANVNVALLGSYTNAIYNGLEVEIIREEPAPTQFAIFIMDGGTLVYTIPPYSNESVKLVYRRFGWTVVSVTKDYKGKPEFVVDSTTTAGPITVTAQQLTGGYLVDGATQTAAFAITTDTAVNILAAMPNVAVGASFKWRFINNDQSATGYAGTLAGGTGVTVGTILPNPAVPKGGLMDYVFTFTAVGATPTLTVEAVGGSSAALL